MLRLDGLSLSGFKSFASRADMTLPEGITCVVGPNGCGKSNIVDAITWVLGETRAKSLRGAKMEDVIFAGSRSRKPGGLAEVSLRFSPRPGGPIAVSLAEAPDQEVLIQPDPAFDASSEEADASAEADADAPEAGEEAADAEDTEAAAEAAAEDGEASTEASEGDDAGKTPAPLPPETFDSRLQESLEITRRLYRNGDSEYLINGQKARLKDVKELLMGTGLTTRAYSIIGQGRVDQILNSKPTDRRMLLEEAAGIAGYRAKRRSAKIKLDDSEQDLLRVTDIISEIEKQLRSLKRQAAAARRYRKHAGRLRILQRALYAVQHAKLGEQLDAARNELAALRMSEDESRAALAAHEESARGARETVASLEEARDVVAQRQQALELELERARGQLSACRERLADNAEQSRRNERARQVAEEDLGRVKERLQEQEERLERLEVELSQAQEALANSKEASSESREKLESAHRVVAETKETIFEVMSEAAGLRNRRAEAEAALERLEVQHARLTESFTEAEAEAARLEAEREAGEETLRLAREREASLKDEFGEAKTALHAQTTEIEAASAKVDEHRRLLNDAEWQLAAVEELIKTRSSFGEGVRRFLESDDGTALGTVSDFVTSDEADATACEKALGPLLQSVVFADRDTAESVVRRLAPGDEPELAFVFPETPPVPSAELASELTGLPSLRQALRVAPEVSWLEGLVPDAVLVDTRDEAIDLSRRHPGLLLVSRDGALLGPWGRGSAGRPLGDGEGILETQSRRDRLAGEVREHGAAVEEAESARAVLDERREELAATVGRLRDELSDAEKAALSARHAQDRLTQGVDTAQAQLSTLTFEHQAVGGELEGARTRISEYAERLQAGMERRETLDATLTDAQGLVTELESEVGSADAERTRLSQEAAIRQDRRQGLASELEPIRAQVAQATERVELLGEESEALTHQKGQLEEIITTSQTTLDEGHPRGEELQSELGVAEEKLNEHRDGMMQEANRLRDLRLSHEERSKAANGVDLRRERLSSQLEHLVADCESQLGMLPTELEIPTPPQPEAEVEEETDAEVAAEADADEPTETEDTEASAEGDSESEESAEGDADDSEETDEDVDSEADEEGEGSTTAEDDEPIDENLPWTEDGELELDLVATEVADVKRKIKNIGPVNLVAIEECDEQEERLSFLTKERDDLVTSIERLKETIEQIDHTSRERFLACFEQVKETFNTSFTKLFRGGRAELRLQDEEDVLESGIEIIAQPPGKRLQNMLLLSGGEKALTAIALLVALFRYKPSPFCVLDEVDAPLDEANVVRFIDLVNSMSKDTQFIVVTHNRRSMEQGKVLYGVTMEEQGCSKLVSVRFDGMTENVA
ncbi:MAG: chromosome segregation protein SMC [Acidobacteriota bacterium]